MIRSKGALYEYMKANPQYQLQYCQGIRGPGWWWLRVGESPGTIDVHGSAAQALVKQGLVERIESRSTYRSFNYKLAA